MDTRKEWHCLRGLLPRFAIVLAVLMSVAGVLSARDTVRFDVMVGYGGFSPQGDWYPVTCELRNDGPSFTGIIEISDDRMAQAPTRRLKIELPSNTTKRVQIPEFTAMRYGSLAIRLLDEKGGIVAEPSFIGAQKTDGVPTLGSVARSGAGVSALPDIKSRNPELQPLTARIQPEFFPDNPIALDGLPNLYLSSERAAALTEPQVMALFAWLQGGGHLIIGIDQIGDVTSKEWLRDLLPFEPQSTRTEDAHAVLDAWVNEYLGEKIGGEPDAPAPMPVQFPQGARRNPGGPAVMSRAPPARRPQDAPPVAAEDFIFESAAMPVMAGVLRDGEPLIGTRENPLAVQARRGRGKITVLTFSPEREPFVSWKNRGWFWARLAGVDANLYKSADHARNYGFLNADSLMGALVDTKQVRKLPLTWLLGLLGAYLIVIGPLDQYVLRKAKRQMLTWVTFPLYVVGFSGLIYFIGFYLRAGELECNELSVVDVLPTSQLKSLAAVAPGAAVTGDKAVLRGLDYDLVYSPANARYPFRSSQKFAAFRGEYMGSGRAQNTKASVAQIGNGFEAEGFIPVWTPMLFVGDWADSGALPARFSVAQTAKGWQVEVDNMTDHKLTFARIVLGQRIYNLGELSGGSNHFSFSRESGQMIFDFVNSQSGLHQAAVNRHNSFRGAAAEIPDLSQAAMAACFPSLFNNAPGMMGIDRSRRLDLADYAGQGDAILLIWDGNQRYSPTLRQFTARRGHHDTLLRLTAPMPKNRPAPDSQP